MAEYTLLPTQSERLPVSDEENQPPSREVDESEPMCAGKNDECNRTVDEQGDRCWQHAED
jgi:hypothetical protein